MNKVVKLPDELRFGASSGIPARKSSDFSVTARHSVNMIDAIHRLGREGFAWQ
ncbi:hypothetical protein [Mycoplana rhizolycopersici]|uniref:Uncharacterized protein n=1 Tax=Mycoplana rhizolycopersici TaxID=2746702 RepID=A0ABX2QG86_9HYPH|nr:hypothetical protein [Rhizobium rhizolycopersici]NVP56233.1 hypothetical protein [Rhizobium rhizolycopersici]